MIIIKQIEVEDFGPFVGKQVLELAPETLLGVLGAYDGEPGRSNGAGKTYLAEALLFGLYGYGRVALDGLVRRGAGGCRVAVSFTDPAEGDFTVERKRGTGEGVMVTFPDGRQPIKGAKAADLFLAARFGTSFDVFLATCFFAQGKADALVQATPSRRKDYLYEILGLEAFDRADKRAGELVRAAEGELVRINADLTAREDMLASVRGVTDAVVARTREAAAKATVAAETAKKHLEEVEAADTAYRQAEAEAQAVAGSVPAAKRMVETAEKALDRANKERDNATLTVQRLERGAVLPEGLEREIAEVRKKLEAQQTALSDAREKAAVAGERISQAQAAKDNLADVKGECPTCRQTVSPAYREGVLKALEKNVQDAVNAERMAKLAMPTLERSVAELTKRVVGMEGDLRKAMTRQAELEAARQAITDGAARVEEAAAAAEGARQDYNATVAEARRVQAKMENRKRPDVEGARRAWSGAEGKMAEAKAAVVDIVAQAARAEKLRGEVEAIKQEQAARGKDRDLWASVREVVGKTGAPALLLDAAVVDMEAAANGLLTRFMPALFLTIDTTRQAQSGKELETLDFVVHEGATSRPFESFSGGERMLLNFCLRLAVAEAVARRSRQGIGFVVLDEVFGSLDDANKGAVTAALRLLQSRFPQQIVITHTDVKDLFPETVTIIKGAEGSRIEANKRAGMVDHRGNTGARADGGKAARPGSADKAGRGGRVRHDASGTAPAKPAARRKGAGKGARG